MSVRSSKKNRMRNSSSRTPLDLLQSFAVSVIGPVLFWTAAAVLVLFSIFFWGVVLTNIR